jgi:hypothetical protein
MTKLREIAIHWRFPGPLPEPLPIWERVASTGRTGRALLKLWEESERETSRIMRENMGRNEDERRFQLHHGHCPRHYYPGARSIWRFCDRSPPRRREQA